MPGKHARPPGPHWSPLEGYRRRRNDVLSMLTEVAAAHPRLAHLRILNRSVYVVVAPDLIREVLVVRPGSVRKGTGIARAVPFLGAGLISNEGEVHKRHRRLVQPAFHKNRIQAYGHLMTAAAESLDWADGQRVDLAEEMGQLTFTIATAAMYGVDLPPEQTAPARAAVQDFALMFRRLSYSPSALLMNLPGPLRSRYGRARRRFDAALAGIVAHRRRRPGDDFLSLLLDSGLTDEEIFDEARTFIAAGHESTSNALTWTLWLLDRHPDVLRRLRAEVDALPGSPTVEDYPRLHYTRATVAESMRVCPPVPVIGRRTIEPITLDGWLIPAGDRLVTSPWVTHRDPRWWGPDAAAFKPERWLNETGEFSERHPGRPPLAYFPFGAGPRLCIGDGFAWLENALVIATLIRRWQLAIARDPRPIPAFTLRTEPPVTALLRSRGVVAADAAAGAPR